MNRLCNTHAHLSRRTLLGAGGGSLMMSALAHNLALSADEKPNDKPKNVILLWLEGGPSQLETFDPHAGTKYGGDVRAIETTTKGLQIADTLPKTAEMMHMASLIRSVTGKEGDHERALYNVKNGYRPDPTLTHPSVGAILLDADNSGADIPRHVSILPQQSPARGGYLGAKFDAFKVYDPATPVPDIRARVDTERFDRRLKDLEFAESQFAKRRLTNLEEKRTLHHETTQAALRMMSSDQLSAFDVSDEPQADLDAFGDTSFGRGCLAATRLIEVGVRCVEVTLGGWDSHANNHGTQLARCETLDSALASLLKRLEERDLLESTLVVCGGEFGRTPRINPAAGRDHWPHGFSTLLAGCGIRRGGVFGETAANPNLELDDLTLNVSDAVKIADVHATILKSLGVDFKEELMTPIGRPLLRSEGRPIESIIQSS